ncbi:MAG: zinc-binding dehydrogenase [Acidimicrobiales bacterium]
MFALVIDDGALAWRERPDPIPGAGDVVVEVAAAGLNAADLLQRRGLYPAPPGVPADVPGLELAGRVAAVGEGVDGSWVGRRVAALTGGGAQATHCAVPLEHLLEVPEGVSLLEAGGFPEAFCTAHDALVTQAALVEGERLLVTGAAGGVGCAAVQIGRALGASVVALTRDPRHDEALRTLGADEVVGVDDLARTESVDVVLELVGAATLPTALRRVRPRGRVVVVGVGSGARVELDLLAVMGSRLTLTGSTLRSRTRAEKADVVARVAHDLGPRWRDGELRVPIAEVVDAREAARAYDLFARPGKFGKIVLAVGPT